MCLVKTPVTMRRHFAYAPAEEGGTGHLAHLPLYLRRTRARSLQCCAITSSSRRYRGMRPQRYSLSDTRRDKVGITAVRRPVAWV